MCRLLTIFGVFASMLLGQIASMPDTVAFAGGSVSIPVVITDVVDLEGLEFTVQFDETVLTVTSTSFENTNLEGMNFNATVGTDNVGEIRVVAFAGGSLYTGSGTVIFAHFDVIGELFESTDLTFTSIEINNVSILTNAQNGSVVILQSGCMDVSACNYDASAKYDDGSCAYESDCFDVCGGSAVVDCAGDCGGQALEDCNSECNGSATVDECGVCDADSTNDCVQDCNDEWGGSAVFDECGVCGGPGAIFDCGCDNEVLHCRDLDGDGWGTGDFTTYTCEEDGDYWVINCDDIDDNLFCESNLLDCDGILCGTTEIDECGVCGGGGLITYYADWDNDGFGICDAELYYECEVNTEDWMTSECGDCDDENINAILYDDCDVCGGDNSTCLGCDGIPNSGLVYDDCDVCGGDNSTCLGCDGIPNSGLVYDDC
ncbi:MAG: hypothetical protein H8E72_06265, partial [Candidatus Marinimicrobia bacterium]|nr:hypothetical protein [Candidatus Neomarinimicrobiota bacterium]